MAQCTATSKRSHEQCKRNAAPGARVCSMHGGKAPQVKAAASKRAARAEAEAEVVKYRARLGVEAIDEPHEVTALTQIRIARGNVSAWQHLVDQLIEERGDDVLAALAVSTGNKQKPNEVEKHFALARLDEERDRLMSWIATARKLGIEEARLEQQEQMAARDAERVIAVIRIAFDGLRQELLDRGTERTVIEATYREAVPKLVAKAIDATSIEATRT